MGAGSWGSGFRGCDWGVVGDNHLQAGKEIPERGLIPLFRGFVGRLSSVCGNFDAPLAPRHGSSTVRAEIPGRLVTGDGRTRALEREIF